MKTDFQPPYDDPLAGPFWQSARAGQLSISWCRQCDHAVWYPRPECPDCQSELHWKTLSGRATLVTWTVVHKAINPLFAPPYMPALVEPVEARGVRLVTQLVQCEPDRLRCDMPLQAVFEQLQPYTGEPFMAPLFRPA